jgi:hypothetical protein
MGDATGGAAEGVTVLYRPVTAEFRGAAPPARPG